MAKNSSMRLACLLLCVCTSIGIALYNGYLYLYHADYLDVDEIYHTMLLKSDGSGTILTVLCLVCCALFALPFLFLIKKKEECPCTKEGIPLLFSRCAAGILLVSCTVMQFLLSPTATPYEVSAQNKTILYISLATAVAGALYFLLPALFALKNHTVLFFLGLSTVVFLCCQLLLSHYFMMDFLSSPTRLWAMFGYGALILFMLFDLRRHVSGRFSSKGLVLWALIAFFANTVDALPRLVLSFAGNEYFPVTLTTFYTLFRLALGLYALMTVLPLCLPQKEPVTAPQSTGEDAEEATQAQEETADGSFEKSVKHPDSENTESTENTEHTENTAEHSVCCESISTTNSAMEAENEGEENHA